MTGEPCRGSGQAWRDVPVEWLRKNALPENGGSGRPVVALFTTMAAEVIRTSLTCLVTAAFGRGALGQHPGARPRPVRVRAAADAVLGEADILCGGWQTHQLPVPR